MASAQPQTARRLALYLVHMLLLHTKDGALDILLATNRPEGGHQEGLWAPARGAWRGAGGAGRRGGAWGRVGDVETKPVLPVYAEDGVTELGTLESG